MSDSPAQPSTTCRPVQLDKTLVPPARSRTRRALRPTTRRSAVELFLTNPKPRKAPHKPKTLRQTNQDAHRRNVRFYRPGGVALRSGLDGRLVVARCPASCRAHLALISRSCPAQAAGEMVSRS